MLQYLQGSWFYQVLKAATSLPLVVVLFSFSAPAYSADPVTVRVGVLKFGTVNWELKSMKHAGYDIAENIAVKVIPFTGSDSTRIALESGSVDIIVADWLWVSRQRANGKMYSFIPYSSSQGAIMVSPDIGINSISDLRGRKIGVARGPLDKSWVLMRSFASRNYRNDLSSTNEIIYASPPSLVKKIRHGDVDAVLTFWHYCARLEAMGFKRLASIADATHALGVEGLVSGVGYVFSDRWAAANPAAAEAFVHASRRTKKLLKESDVEWRRLGATGAIKDKGNALLVLRDRFREGIPARPIRDEIEDTKRMYRVLARLGGMGLVGSSPELAADTYWPRLTTILN